jgi:DNA-binding NarL/FixJ family response regulator
MSAPIAFAHRSRFAIRRRPANTKLSEETVRAIKQDLAKGLSHRAIGQARGISPKTVSSIACGLTWGWVQIPLAEEPPPAA